MARLASGAELRLTGPTDRAAVICVNGGQRAEVEGTWSAAVAPGPARLHPVAGPAPPRRPGVADPAVAGLPGVQAGESPRGFRARRRLGGGRWVTVHPGAVHGMALRAHWGRPVPLPRAGAW